MAYEIHIRRQDPATGEMLRPITSAEWDALVASDPDLLHVETAAATNPVTGEVIRIRVPGTVMWRTPAGRDVALGLRDGEISAPADDEVIAKAVEIAGGLDAVVVGDDGESYPQP